MIKRSSYVYEIYRRAYMPKFKGLLGECQIALATRHALGHEYYWMYAPGDCMGASTMPEFINSIHNNKRLQLTMLKKRN